MAFIYYVLSGESDLDTILDRDCHSDKSNDGNDEDRSSAPRDETIRASSESAPSTFGSDEARKAVLKARTLDELEGNMPENFKNINSIFINNKVIGIADDGNNEFLSNDIPDNGINVEGFLINESLQHSMVLEVKVEEVI